MHLFFAGIVLGTVGLFILLQRDEPDEYEPVAFRKKEKDE
jgi:hypothetical protein